MRQSVAFSVLLLAVTCTMARPETGYGAPPLGNTVGGGYAGTGGFGGLGAGGGGGLGPISPAQYSFAYENVDGLSGNQYGHGEERDGDTTQGEYRVLLPDGRTQVVKYFVSGDAGYVAEVTYEGTATVLPGGGGGGYQAPAPSRPAPGGGGGSGGGGGGLNSGYLPPTH